MKSLKVSIIAQGMMGPSGDDGPLGLEGQQVRLAWTCKTIWTWFNTEQQTKATRGHALQRFYHGYVIF